MKFKNFLDNALSIGVFVSVLSVPMISIFILFNVLLAVLTASGVTSEEADTLELAAAEYHTATVESIDVVNGVVTLSDGVEIDTVDRTPLVKTELPNVGDTIEYSTTKKHKDRLFRDIVVTDDTIYKTFKIKNTKN